MSDPLAPRELLVLRHAKSDWASGAESDFDRPLNAKGKKDAPHMGRWMKENDLIPDLVVASPAKRARGTAKAVAKELGIPKEDIRWEEMIYESSLQTLLELVSALPVEARRVLLVGHNPGLEELVTFLVPLVQLPDPPVNYLKTATLAQLAVSASWEEVSRGCANLAQLMRPKLIDRM